MSEDNAIEWNIEVKVDSLNKEIKEVVKLITVPTLLGSLGGSLGMFFGFSFIGPLIFLLEFFMNLK